MNKRGTSLMVVLMFAVLLYFFGLAIGSPLNSVVQNARTSMACSTNFANLDFGTQATCTMTDLYSPFFVAIIFGLGGVLIGVKLQ